MEEELRLKYRPKNFDEFYGNKSIVKSLQSKLNRPESFPHTILLQGPSGCGKTTLARIIAKELNCTDDNLREINISDMRGIDMAREIINNCRYAPLGKSKCRVFILDEVHKATNEFQNAMLNVLESPPAHVYFMLCTTEPEKLLKTIRGQRATVFQVFPLVNPKMMKLLKDICKKEDAPFPDKHLKEIVNVANGSPRAALAILDQIIDIEDDEDAYNAIVDASVTERDVKELIDLLMKPNAKWKDMAQAIKNLSAEPEKARQAIKGYFGAVVLNSGSERAFEVMALFTENFYNSGREGLIEACWLVCNKLK